MFSIRRNKNHSIYEIVFIFVAYHVILCAGYSIPDPDFQLLTPKGLRVSIPDVQGIKLFAFHGSVRKTLSGNEQGDFYGEVSHPTDGKWIFETTKEFIDPGDIISYWVHVQFMSLGYAALNKTYRIPENKGNTEIEMRFSTTDFTPPLTSAIAEECIPSKTRVYGRSVCKGDLIFHDDFSQFDRNKWSKDIRIPLDRDDAEFVSFQNRTDNLFVNDGKLCILPTLLTDAPGFENDSIRTGVLTLAPECTARFDVTSECSRQATGFRILPPVVSARIQTKDSFSFLYGKVEVRAKLPKGDWIFPQIFLEPKSNEYGVTGYASGQMRIAFIRGNEILDTKENIQIDGHRLSGGVVLATSEKFRDIWLKNTFGEKHWGNGFHTYTLVWSDQTITLSVDGTIYATLRGNFKNTHSSHNISHAQLWEKGGLMAPFDKEFYISLGVSVGGLADFPDGCRSGTQMKLKPWGNTSPKAELNFWKNREQWYHTWQGEHVVMKVDYVKVWAL